MSHQGVCCDCHKPFYRRRRDTVRCKLCIMLKERADQRARNAKRSHVRCRGCGHQGNLNRSRLCIHCSQTGDLPAELIEARYQAALVRVRWERSQSL